MDCLAEGSLKGSSLNENNILQRKITNSEAVLKDVFIPIAIMYQKTSYQNCLLHFYVEMRLLSAPSLDTSEIISPCF
jgi:hypothetical protein